MTKPPGKTFHLIEPDIAVRDSIKILLESFDANVSTYTTGRSFFTNAKLNKHDCILVENDLSDITGLELCERLNKIDSTLHIIILTSVNDSAFEKIIQSDVAAIMQKPIQSERLLETISNL